MRILLVSDIHGQSLAVYKLLSKIQMPDLTVIAGDITNFGGYQDAATIIEPFILRAIPVLAVAGNCDTNGVADYLVDKNISLNSHLVRQGDLSFIGANGSLPCPGTTVMEYGDSVFFTALSRALNHTQNPAADAQVHNLIVVTHQPAFGTAVDTVGSRHTGSDSIRRFIETHKPILALSGHIHEAWGKDTIGPTQIINPGPLAKGHYAEITLENSRININFCQL